MQGPHAGVLKKSELWASSDEALRVGKSGRVDPCDLKSEEVASFDSVEWDDSEPNASLDRDALAISMADLDSVSSSDWEVVTTLDATFQGVPRVSLAAGLDV